eukprot:TRINITY_DN1906_c0_g1_i1.p1 TRINITY_DN1906_c0_g1~~TRINITY_DN1906_c0_g1_i1.p1  ORF type:complete len:301 (-),score=22.41 TRINITY_DN1906_c0_g1_i1:50-952(-)
MRRPPRSTLSSSSAASDVYKRQYQRRVREDSVLFMAVPDLGPTLESSALGSRCSSVLREAHARPKTVHCGIVPNPRPKQTAEQAAISQTYLDSMTNQVACPGVLNQTWLAYKRFEAAAPRSPEDKAQSGLRIFPNCLPVSGALSSTTTASFITPRAHAWSGTQPMWKDGVPFQNGRPFDVSLSERRCRRDDYVSGIGPMWRGCVMRCQPSDTLKNGWRPAPIDGGWAPKEYGRAPGSGLANVLGRPKRKVPRAGTVQAAKRAPYGAVRADPRRPPAHLVVRCGPGRSSSAGLRSRAERYN